MDFPEESSKLSLLAAYDDLIRAQQSIYESVNDGFLAPIKLANDYELLRQKYFSVLQEISRMNSEIEQLSKDNHLLKLHLTSVRQAYTRETSKYDALMKDYKVLAKKVAAVQDVLNEEERSGKPSLERHNSVLSILSSLKDIHALQTIHDDSNPSDDGLLFDKSEGSLDGLDHTTMAKIPKMDIVQSSAQIQVKTESRPVIIPSTSNVDILQTPLKKSASTVSNFGTFMHRLNAMRKGAKFDNKRLDVREHTFHQKKAFKPSTVCGACGKTIGFCTNYLICNDCHGITHANDKCKTMLPKPCVPFTTTNAGLKRMQSCVQVGQIVRLADFTETGSRPCVPALLIHCCNEIDRRVEDAKKNPSSLTSSLSRLYCGQSAEKEARELRNRILSGNGIPNLSNVEPNVLCSVVKSFLHDLDDPVVTQIMWNDFVRASEHIQKIFQGDGSLTDSDYESHHDNESNGSSNEEWQESLRVLKGVIIQLPNANRDSLCFLFLHFHRLLNSQTVVKLSVDDLARTFAPTIVGRSRPNNGNLRLSSGDSRRESDKQMMVMQAFFKLSCRFWDGLLKDPNFCPFEPVTDSVNNRTVFSSSFIQRKRRTTINVRNILEGNTPDAAY